MDRVALAKARLEQVTDIARRAGEAGPPCMDCRLRTVLGTCGSPVYVSQTFDPARGKYSEHYVVDVEEARAETGLCGPEGLLWEPISKPRAVLNSVVSYVELNPWRSLVGGVGLWWLIDLAF
jgi:hypothetical protein